MSARELYQYMVDHPGVYPKTAQPSIEEYLTRFERYTRAGKGVICCTVNQNFSGSYNAALLAKQMTEEMLPDARIEVVDTMQATLMQGLILQEAFRKEWPEFDQDIEIAQIGSVIGVHTGPYPIGFGVVEKWNADRH